MSQTEVDCWKILYIEDDEDDYILTRQMLAEARGRKIELSWATCYDEGSLKLEKDHFDAVLVDYDLGNATGIELIEKFGVHYPAPMILYTGRGSHEVDLEAMAAGATLYLTKSEANPLLLERSIRYAIEIKQRETVGRRQEAELQAVASLDAYLLNLSDTIRTLEDSEAIRFAACRLLGEYLEVDRVYYSVLEFVNGIEYIVHPQEYYSNGMTDSLAGRQRVSDQSQWVFDELRATRPVVVQDVQEIEQESKAERAFYASMQVAAFVYYPLVKAGQLRAILGITQSIPRLWSDEQLVAIRETAERTRAAVERARAEEALRFSQIKLAAELADTERLQQISSELIQEEQIEALYEHILEAAMAFMHAEAGSLQVYDPDRNRLHLLALKGFDPESAEFWTWVQEETKTPCGMALFQRKRVIVPDIESSEFLAGTQDQESYRRSGLRAVQSTPLVARNGQLVGMFSTHWRAPYQPDERQLRLLDVLARQAADLIEQAQVAAKQKAAAARDAFLLKLSDALRPLCDPVAIQAEAVRVLGEHLRANQVHYSETVGDVVIIQQGYSQGLPPMVGSFRHQDFGQQLFATYRAGQTAVCDNVATDPTISDAEKEVIIGSGIRAYIAVPLVKEGEWVATLAVQSIEPRAWSPEEVALVEETAERTWAAVERAQAEEALKRSEDKYRTLFDSLDEGCCIVEVLFDENKRPVDYRFLEVNAMFEQQTGIHNGVGRRIREFAPRHEEHWFEIYGRIAKTGEAIRFENAAEQLNRFYDVFAFRIGRPEEHMVAVLFKDIAEKKRWEQDLKHYAQDLERSNQSLLEFTFIASHDLQEPLRKIKSFGRILANRFSTELGEEGRDYIDRMNSASERMQTLLRGLLEYSRVSNKGEQFTQVDLHQVMAEVLSDLEARLLETGGKVTVGKLHTVHGDPLQIRQLLQNLIGNALKYHRPGVPPQVTVAGRKIKDHQVEISIQDNGTGFDMQQAGRLFEPFTRLHQKSEYEGIGMGLAICKKIVERHYGSISVESIPDRGSTFKVTLPLHH